MARWVHYPIPHEVARQFLCSDLLIHRQTTELVMFDSHDHEPHHRPHVPLMAFPYMEFDLVGEVHRLKAESSWDTGHNAKTLIKYDDLRVVLMALQSGARLPEHQTDGRLC